MTMDTRTTARAFIRRVGPRQYAVSSQTHEGDFHTYDLVTHSCTCKAGQEGRFCWHWGAALAADDYYDFCRVFDGQEPDCCCCVGGHMMQAAAS